MYFSNVFHKRYSRIIASLMIEIKLEKKSHSKLIVQTQEIIYYNKHIYSPKMHSWMNDYLRFLCTYKGKSIRSFQTCKLHTLSFCSYRMKKIINSIYFFILKIAYLQKCWGILQIIFNFQFNAHSRIWIGGNI